MDNQSFIPFEGLQLDESEMLEKSREFFELMDKRRSLREFSDRAVNVEVLKNAIATASTAPSGAHKQPWTFCLVSNPEIKHKIREAAEKEEYENYHGRMSDQWLKDLEPFETNHVKEFLDIAPYLIVVFKRVYESDGEGKKKNNYYVNESVGIATGMLLTALHQAGLVTLTHTPSPMNFLEKVLERPANERAYLLIPVGFPADNAKVPDLQRKALDEVMVHIK